MTRNRFRDPLRPGVYLVRNLGKTAPLGAVIVLAVLLIAGIVALINSIPLSIKVIYSYSRHYIGVTPRGDPTMTPVLKRTFEQDSPVPIDRVMTIRGSYIQVKSLVGEWPFVALALNPADTAFYIHRMGGTLTTGRLPLAAQPEIVVSRRLATNLGLKLGSTVLGPELRDAYSPTEVKVCGIVESDEWFALMPYDYHVLNHFPPIDSLLVFSKDPASQRELDAWATKALAGKRTELYTYDLLEKQADTMFNILYQILNVVIGTLVVVITVMMAMLINIYLGQRVQEFGLLQALGYPRRKILSRVMTEVGIVVLGGWIVGVFAAYGLLNIVKAVMMEPRAFALDTLDQSAYLYTVPVPVAISLVAFATVIGRFKKFDPVGIVERRLV